MNSLTRRNFLKRTAIAAAGIAFLKNELYAKAGSSSIKELGIITNTVKAHLKEDWQSVLKSIKAAGYSFVEGGVNVAGSVKEYKNFLDDIGLKHLATGGSIHGMLENSQKTIDEAKKAGCEYVVCYWPWLDSAENITYDQAIECAENLNKLGKICADEGLKFAFHNHDKEFQIVEDQYVMDIILNNTDKKLVDVELDIYWVLYANADPVKLFKQYPGRFTLWHLKDMSRDEEKRRLCPGEGIVDFTKYLKHSELAGVKHYIVENESCEDEHQMKCMRGSYKYLSNLTF